MNTLCACSSFFFFILGCHVLKSPHILLRTIVLNKVSLLFRFEYLSTATQYALPVGTIEIDCAAQLCICGVIAFRYCNHKFNPSLEKLLLQIVSLVGAPVEEQKCFSVYGSPLVCLVYLGCNPHILYKYLIPGLSSIYRVMVHICHYPIICRLKVAGI